MNAVFMSETNIAQSWYVIDRVDAFKPGDVRTYHVLKRKLVVFCDEHGNIQALDARCPHLGADLGQGKVVNGSLRCAMHHWCFGRSGACTSAPGFNTPPARRVRHYPTQIAWGLVWIFNADEPLFELPSVLGEQRWHAVHLLPQSIACHPHLVVGNGLDVDHVQGLHDMALTGTPKIQQPDDFSVEVSMVAQPRNKWVRRFSGAQRAPIHATFRAIGGSIAWASISGAVNFHTLFTGRLGEDAGVCETQTVVFLKRKHPKDLWIAGVILYALLRDDREALEGMRFEPDFTERDTALAHYVEMINNLPVG